MRNKLGLVAWGYKFCSWMATWKDVHILGHHWGPGDSDMDMAIGNSISYQVREYMGLKLRLFDPSTSAHLSSIVHSIVQQ